MTHTIFLEENKNKFSNNTESVIDVALSTKIRPLPFDNISKQVSLYEQYNNEKDNCNKFRLLLTINPVCSNVLFNRKTEILINEGSSKCDSLIETNYFPKPEWATNTTPKIFHIDAIRNTEYSHVDNGNFIYHCGIDIFNNHMLRKKSFIHINPLSDRSKSKCGRVYNTISDYNRDSRGNIIKEDISVIYSSATPTEMHLYQKDDIMTMDEAFIDNCIEKNGWWGFTNPGTIEIPNTDDKTKSINRLFANNKSCEFIDLYPDRSLFSFIPKYNKSKNRLEKNWDYCITYPYKRDYKKINDICGGEDGAIRANIKVVFDTNGREIIQCSSYFKHNLNIGDYVTFYYYKPNEDDTNKLTFTKHETTVKVQSIGDLNGNNKERLFSVKHSEIETIYNYMVDNGCFYKKKYNDSECVYYFRKFKKIKTINNEELRNDINKIAFGKNIYNDDVAQIVFIDDVDIEGLVDHNGRAVSEVFFTTVKRNAGYKSWYEDNNFSGDTIEFSHCFGKVTSGIDFCGIENEPFDYNVHYLNNINDTSLEDNDVKLTKLIWGDTILKTPKILEDDITIENDEFYGDIIEYNITTATETVIGNVYHRFNTAQRESWNAVYKDIKHDEIEYDDYDCVNSDAQKYEIKTYYVNNTKTYKSTKPSEYDVYGNIAPEGYFYNPHTKIKLKEDSPNAITSKAKQLNYRDALVATVKEFILYKKDGSFEIYESEEDAAANAGEGDVVVFNTYYKITLEGYPSCNIIKGDTVALYNIKSSDVIWGEVDYASSTKLTLIVGIDAFDMVINNEHFSPKSDERIFYAFWTMEDVPFYSKLTSRGVFVWRDVVAPSKLNKNSNLYNTPFANGRFYINQNINFFLKRQDPNGNYGLSIPIYKITSGTTFNPMLKYNIKGVEPIDFSEVMYTLNNFINNCY